MNDYGFGGIDGRDMAIRELEDRGAAYRQRIADLEAQVRQLEAALVDVEPLESVLLNLHSDGYEVTYMGDGYVAEIYGPVEEPDPTGPFTPRRATLGWGEDEDIDAAIRAAVANATKGESDESLS